MKCSGMRCGVSLVSFHGPCSYHLTTYFDCGLVPMLQIALSTTNFCCWVVSFWTGFFSKVDSSRNISSVRLELFVLSDWCRRLVWLNLVRESVRLSMLSVVSRVRQSSNSFFELWIFWIGQTYAVVTSRMFISILLQRCSHWLTVVGDYLRKRTRLD